VTTLLQPAVHITARKHLIDQKSLRAMSSEAHEDDKKGMPKFTQHLHLLLKAGFIWNVEDLDGYLSTVLQNSFEDPAIGTRAQLHALVEVPRGLTQLLIRVLQADVVKASISIGRRRCSSQHLEGRRRDARALLVALLGLLMMLVLLMVLLLLLLLLMLWMRVQVCCWRRVTVLLAWNLL